jgi:serine/threonine-protein kinase
MSYTTLPRDYLHKRRIAKAPAHDGAGIAPRKVQCRLAPASGSGFTDEMSQLLRMRLRLAILVMLGGCVIHFLQIALWPGAVYDHRAVWLLLSACEIALMASALGLLWSRIPLSMKQLRATEVVFFASIAALFAWLQVDTYHDGAVLRAIVPGHEPLVYGLVSMSAALRWFLLVVLYGVFIPNTARRCAAVVGSLALVPVLLMVGGSFFDKTTAAYVLAGLPKMIVLMATAVVITVFGSHKMRELYQKAHEATRIGQYRIKEVLGFGGMGAVYLAEHVLLRRPCAIKLIRPDQAGDPNTFLRFEREVQAAATLTHWNTIEIFDYGHAEDGTFYYVMEYLPGKNLEELVEQHGPLPAERAVHLLRQVCQALREAHGIGLIHRDIKPSNIFASERGKIYDVAKLLDFGLVKTVTTNGDALKLTRDGAFAGSPAFMSPEQALGRQQLDARSDIYNVGAVAYFLITGKLPFERESSLQMLHAHAYEPFVPQADFTDAAPAELQRIIRRCLEKDPEHRYQDVASLERALAECEITEAWTSERAEEWWRRYGGIGRLPAATEAAKRDHETELVGV